MLLQYKDNKQGALSAVKFHHRHVNNNLNFSEYLSHRHDKCMCRKLEISVFKLSNGENKYSLIKVFI